MGDMDTQTTPTFDIGFHRYVAQQIESGRATTGLIEGSHEQLLAEVERLTAILSEVKSKQPITVNTREGLQALIEVERLLHQVPLPVSEPAIATETIPVSTFVGLIDALAKQDAEAKVIVEYMGMRSNPRAMGSYRGFYDQLAIRPDGMDPRTVGVVLKKLRSILRKGIDGEGGPYKIDTFTGVWVDRGQAEGQHLCALRVEGDSVVLMTEPREW